MKILIIVTSIGDFFANGKLIPDYGLVSLLIYHSAKKAAMT